MFTHTHALTCISPDGGGERLSSLFVRRSAPNADLCGTPRPYVSAGPSTDQPVRDSLSTARRSAPGQRAGPGRAHTMVTPQGSGVRAGIRLRGDGPHRRLSDGGRAVTSERPCGQDRCLGRRQGSISSAARSAAAMASGLPVRVKTSTAVSANLITCASPCSTARAKTSRAVSWRDCPPCGCCS